MKLEKVNVGSSTRKLSADYKVEQSQDVEHIIGDELQKAIDDEILNTLVGPHLIEEGWTQVVIRGWQNISQEWLNENIKDKHGYAGYGYYWYFKNKDDATMFALKWCQMVTWAFCDDLDAPELGVCTSMDWWNKNKTIVMEWFQNEGKGVGSVVSDNMIFIYPQQRALFLLRFGP